MCAHVTHEAHIASLLKHGLRHDITFQGDQVGGLSVAADKLTTGKELTSIAGIGPLSPSS